MHFLETSHSDNDTHPGGATAQTRLISAPTVTPASKAFFLLFSYSTSCADTQRRPPIPPLQQMVTPVSIFSLLRADGISARYAQVFFVTYQRGYHRGCLRYIHSLLHRSVAVVIARRSCCRQVCVPEKYCQSSKPLG